MIQHFLFYFCATLILINALNVAFNPNPVYGALSLMGTLFFLGIIYLIYNQDFFAAMQILVYSGAIMVLFLFIIMLLNLSTKKTKKISGVRLVCYLAIITFIGGKLIVAFILWSPELIKKGLYSANYIEKVGYIKAIGYELFTKYLLPFEVIAFLLFIVVVGAMMITRKETQNIKK